MPSGRRVRRFTFEGRFLAQARGSLFWFSVHLQLKSDAGRLADGDEPKDVLMDRTQKAEMVDWIGGVFDNNAVVVVKNGGLSVAEMSELRGELREAGASMKVVKNRLAKIAISGKAAQEISGLFEGPTAIAFSEDPVAAAKAVHAYAKKNEKLEILGGAMGEEMLDEKAVKALASMPSREDILASIVQAIMSPASEIVGAVTAPAAELAGILKTLEEREAA